MGTGNISDVVDATVADASDLNQYSSAIKQDFVPRNSSGVATNDAGSLGQSSLQWLKGWFTTIGFGASSSDNSLDEDGSNNPTIKRDGSVVATFDANGITQGSLQPVGTFETSSCGTFSVTGTTETDITNFSISVTATGRPVYVTLIPDGTANACFFDMSNASDAVDVSFYLYRDAGKVQTSRTFLVAGGATSATNSPPVGSIVFADIPSAGTYTYKIAVENSSSGTTTDLNYAKMVAFEL